MLMELKQSLLPTVHLLVVWSQRGGTRWRWKELDVVTTGSVPLPSTILQSELGIQNLRGFPFPSQLSDSASVSDGEAVPLFLPLEDQCSTTPGRWAFHSRVPEALRKGPTLEQIHRY